jgi:hypothetical protein
MSNIEYLGFAGLGNPVEMPIEPKNARITSVWLDGDVVDGCIFTEACWFVTEFEEKGMYRHHSDKLMTFIGSDPDDHENLNAEIELWIENDRLVFDRTSIVFVPAGTAHGKMIVRNLTKPIIYYTCHMNSSYYEATPAEATAAPGTYNRNRIEKYAPVDGYLPPAPEGFLTRLLWIDGQKLKGAPYMESVWFHTTNDTGPETHVHDFDEVIGFIGSNPDSPQDLGAEIRFFLDGDEATITKNCIAYVPRGTAHSPLLVPRLNSPIIHFSGGNGGSYARKV